MNLSDEEHGPRIAPSARGGSLLVSLYSWTCITLGVVITRLVIGCIHKIEFGLDDATIVGASLAYLGATISWQYAIDGGLGMHFVEVGADDATKFFKASYAAQILAVVAMTSAKLSYALLVARVAPQTSRAKTALLGMIALWGIYSIFAVSFMCGLPEPWNTVSRKCSTDGVLASVIVLNMVTDVILASWIFPTLRNLAMNKERRIIVAILFGSRICVPIVAGAQCWAAIKAIPSDDPTWDSFELALLNQAVSSLSLIFASVPRIKRFLGGGSGMLYPAITEAEIAHTTTAGHDDSSVTAIPLKLVPSQSNKFTTTVMSGSDKDKAKPHSDWQKFLSMGSKQDEHTSTSSLFDRNDLGGVMLQQEVTVKVENKDNDTPK